MTHKWWGHHKMIEGGGDEMASGRALTVFISYASQDAAVANSIVESLEQQGLVCWIAPRDVKPGALYADAIVRAINDANAMVLVLSASAVVSAHVGREVERAASKHKPIFGLRIDAAPLSPELEYFLSNSQWIDAPTLGMPAALAKLAEAVGQESGPPVAVARANPRPRAGGRAKLIAGAAVVLTLGVAAAFGVHFWSRTHQSVPTASAVAISDKSIAVLPFVDMSEKKDQEYFADGMAEELLDLLAKTPGLHVIARTSSFYFKGKQATVPEIARTLAVANILEGSVRKSGSALRVTAQFIRVDNGYHIWSETYDRNQEDVFKIQDDIARAVVDKLRLTLLGGEVPRPNSAVVNPQVYNLYLQGRYLITSDTAEDLVKANECFQKALQLEPGYAPAWAGAAQVALRQVANGYAPVAETIARADATAEKAVQLDPTYADGFVALGRARMMSSFDWNGAREASRARAAARSQQ
jgi:TolB-like protein